MHKTWKIDCRLLKTCGIGFCKKCLSAIVYTKCRLLLDFWFSQTITRSFLLLWNSQRLTNIQHQCHQYQYQHGAIPIPIPTPIQTTTCRKLGIFIFPRIRARRPVTSSWFIMINIDVISSYFIMISIDYSCTPQISSWFQLYTTAVSRKLAVQARLSQKNQPNYRMHPLVLQNCGQCDE